MTAGEGTSEVEIFGERYTLRATDSPAYLTRLAAYVDGKFHEVAKEGPPLSPAKLAVLASLNIADELFKREEATDRVQQEILSRIDGIFQLLHRGGVAE